MKYVACNLLFFRVINFSGLNEEVSIVILKNNVIIIRNNIDINISSIKYVEHLEKKPLYLITGVVLSVSYFSKKLE